MKKLPVMLLAGLSTEKLGGHDEMTGTFCEYSRAVGYCRICNNF